MSTENVSNEEKGNGVLADVMFSLFSQFGWGAVDLILIII